MLTGNIIMSAIVAVEYNYQLDDVLKVLNKIYKEVRFIDSIESTVTAIYWKMD